MFPSPWIQPYKVSYAALSLLPRAFKVLLKNIGSFKNVSKTSQDSIITNDPGNKIKESPQLKIINKPIKHQPVCKNLLKKLNLHKQTNNMEPKHIRATVRFTTNTDNNPNPMPSDILLI